jgi:hypothetical protein
MMHIATGSLDHQSSSILFLPFFYPSVIRQHSALHNPFTHAATEPMPSSIHSAAVLALHFGSCG